MSEIVEVKPAKFLGGTFHPGVQIRKRRDHTTLSLWLGMIYPGNTYKVTDMWIDPKNANTWLKLAEGGWCGFLIGDGVYGQLESEWE